MRLRTAARLAAASGGHVEFAQIAGVLEGIAAALSYAEHLTLVHRDLKPQNVLVGRDGHVKLANFGRAT